MAGRVAASQLYATGCLNKLLSPDRVNSLIEGDSNIDYLNNIYAVFEERKLRILNNLTAASDFLIFESYVETNNLPLKSPRITKLGEDLFLKYSQESSIFNTQFEVKNLPPHIVPFDLSSENPFGSLIAETKDVYIDLAVFFSYSTPSRIKWRTCIEESRWECPLFNSSKYTEDLESVFTSLWQSFSNNLKNTNISCLIRKLVSNCRTSTC